jgi:hypothetical protein
MPEPSATTKGKVLQYIGPTGNGYNQGWFYIGVERPANPPDDPGAYLWNALYTNSVDNVSYPVASSAVYNALSTKQDVIQVTTMPTASQDLEGKILQYVGANISNSYQKGWFYVCEINPFGGQYQWSSIISDKVGNYDSPVTSRAVYAVTSTLQKKITRSTQITIPTSAWNSTTKQQTITLYPTYSFKDANRNVIDITLGEEQDWADNGVMPVSTTTTTVDNVTYLKSITFECEDVPDTALTFRVTSMEVS